jgi:hypothetical protein
LRKRAACLFALSAIAASASARANPSARLVYVRGPGAESCPDEDAVRTAVAARLGYDPFHAVASTTIFAEVTHARAGFGAEVKLVDDHGVQRGARKIATTGDCRAVIDAMALTISIVVDPLSLTGPRPPPVVEEPPPVEPEPPPPAPPAPPPPIAPPPPPPVDRSGRVSGFAGVGTIASLGMAPGLAVGGTAFGGVRWRWISLALEGRIDLPSSAATAEGSRVRSNAIAGSFVPCVHLEVPFACALVTMGALHATSDAEQRRSATALYTGLGARLGVAIPLATWLDLRPHVDALFSLHGHALQVGGVDVFTFPVVSGAAGLSASVRFP